MAAARSADWRTSLLAFVAEARHRTLVYGEYDCALFAAEAVRVMTGLDLAAPFRGRYTTLEGGLRVLRRHGFADHVALARAELETIAVAAAMPGDLAVFAVDPVPALGVVQGAAVYVLGRNGGLGLMPLTEAVEAFRV
ncbi:MAG: hypothetical protein JNK34_05755 [Tabrizicola sp.]|nr:hypothetical protein [Tabrizicola sp.]